jgi:UDP-GlcNAc:undecaprenyl-phosphate GlcNAc-1-phosphate transferase
MLISILVGAAVSLGCAAVLRMWARGRGINGKVGAAAGAGARALPPIGGLAFVAGWLGGWLVWRQAQGLAWTEAEAALLAAAGVAFAVGLIDDFARELSPAQKLLGQALAWLLLVRGGITTAIAFLPDWANLVVSLVWFLAIMNAMNFLDIADGLAGGIALIASATLCFLSLQAGQTALAGMLAVIAAALAGVLVFNVPRASLFLGDSGSLLLGLLLAALSISVRYAPLGREIALLTPVVVLGLPLWDLAFVTLMRVRQRRSILRKSPDHFVFRLIRRGYSPPRALLAMLALSAAFSVVALVVSRASNAVGLVTVAAVLAFAVWWAARMAQVPAEG